MKFQVLSWKNPWKNSIVNIFERVNGANVEKEKKIWFSPVSGDEQG